MMVKLKSIPANSVVLLHACAHNPTGFDPSKDQWHQILETVKERKLLPFFDMAYQGFATGDLNQDAYAPRLFAKEGVEMLLGQSFSKNLGLYSERTGALHIVCKNTSIAGNVKSLLSRMLRLSSSGCPSHGARVVTKIMEDKGLYDLWMQDLTEVSGRIKQVRKMLRDKLVEMGTKGNWDHIVKQVGMFSYSGLTGIIQLLTQHQQLNNAGRW
eukprot:TRINITY_DN7119_c0_g2_i1.p3 TRINITY_DN7119_c0_g2~~TRINITY_DN7119_c0_g2_i1.p3  ORF type:complete len:213 (+),score=11.99 TRINITY_DN7119_c0_g2_i1:757-1395(+)